MAVEQLDDNIGIIQLLLGHNDVNVNTTDAVSVIMIYFLPFNSLKSANYIKIQEKSQNSFVKY